MTRPSRIQSPKRKNLATNKAHRSLLIIDDARLRKEGFSLAEKIIKKIDRLEDNIASFHESDQRLFNDWFELTFRDERQKTEKMQAELTELVKFHNWIVAIAQRHDISMPEAFKIAQNEADRYASGEEQERRKIEEERASRDQFIHDEMEREFRERYDMDEEEDPDWDDDETSTRSSRTPDEEELFAELSQLNDKKIRQSCRHQEGAFEMLSLALGLSRDLSESKLFLRVWDLTPQKHQNAFAKMFTKTQGVSLHAVIKDLREMIEAVDEMERDLPHEAYADDEFAEDGDEDWEEFLSSGGTSYAGRKLNPEQEELLKLTYRKLVRRLHPDLQDPQAKANEIRWQKKIWDRVQLAHKTNDLPSLDRLYKLTLLRQNRLSELTMSEIHESRQWLDDEFSRLQFEANEMKRLPAWGFSRAKSHDSAAKKVKKELARQQDDLQEQIDDIKEQHAMFEVLSRIDDQTSRRRSKKKSDRRSTVQTKRRSKTKDPKQTSMFD